MLHFEGRKGYIDRLKSLLLKYTAKILTKLRFFLIYSFTFELMDGNIEQGNNNRVELSKVRIIGIRIIGGIFKAQSADCSGKQILFKLTESSNY